MPQTLEHVAILDLARRAARHRGADQDRPRRRRAWSTRRAPRSLRCSPARRVRGRADRRGRRHCSATASTRCAPRCASLARDAGRRRVHGRFRFAVDREFTLAGTGTVVTGTGCPARSRSARRCACHRTARGPRARHRSATSRAVRRRRAGERCALNLAGAYLKRIAIARGDWIVDRGRARAHRAHRRAAQRSARPSTGRCAHGRQVHLHLGAGDRRRARRAARTAHARGGRSSALVQLILDRPIGALHGDRFIVRDATPQSHPRRRRGDRPVRPDRGRARPERLAELGALALPEATAALAALLEQSTAPIDLDRFCQARNLDAVEADQLVQDKQALTVVHGARIAEASAATSPSGPIAGSWGVATTRWRGLLDRLAAMLDDLHPAEPDRVGAAESELARRLGADPLAPLVPAALAALLADGTIVRDGFCLRRPAHRARLSDADQVLLDRVSARLQAAGLRPPIVGDLAVALDTPLPALLGDLVSLARRGHLVQVAKNRFFLPATVRALGELAGELAREAGDDRLRRRRLPRPQRPRPQPDDRGAGASRSHRRHALSRRPPPHDRAGARGNVKARKSSAFRWACPSFEVVEARLAHRVGSTATLIPPTPFLS